MTDRHAGKCYRCRVHFQAGREHSAIISVGSLTGAGTYRVELCSACIDELQRGKRNAEEGPHA